MYNVSDVSLRNKIFFSFHSTVKIVLLRRKVIKHIFKRYVNYSGLFLCDFSNFCIHLKSKIKYTLSEYLSTKLYDEYLKKQTSGHNIYKPSVT